MNRDQVKGSIKDAAGKVQEQAGKVTGSTGQQAKGLAKQAEGKIQKGVGDADHALKNSNHKWSACIRPETSSISIDMAQRMDMMQMMMDRMPPSPARK